MLIQPTQYRAVDVAQMDDQQYVVVGDEGAVVLYSVRQAGQIKKIEGLLEVGTVQMKVVKGSVMMVLHIDTSTVKVLDIERERVSQIVFDQIISEKIRTIRPLNENTLVITTQGSNIYLVNY